MKKRYEYHIENINSASLVSLDDPCRFSTIYERAYDADGNPLTYFIESFASEKDYDSKKGLVGHICPRCGNWVFVDKDQDQDDNPYCSKCDEDYQNIYSEEEMIDLILSWMVDDIYPYSEIRINDELIKA